MKAWILWAFLVPMACTRVDAQHEDHGGAATRPAAPADTAAPPTAPATPSAAGGHAGHGLPGAATRTDAHPPGYAALELPPELTRRLDIAWIAVERRRLKRVVTGYGAIVLDETRTSHVHPKVRGWVEQARVAFAGSAVAAGDPLCTLYSPEVYAAQMELLAMRSSGGAADDPFALADRRMRGLATSAGRRRLMLWDVPQEEVREMLRTGQARRTFTLRAPRSGTVVALGAVAGTYVDASTELYTLSDLARLWAVVDLYAADWQAFQTKAHATLHIEGEAKPRHAAVAFVAPRLDEQTRTLQVRFDLDNADGRLRPGAWVTAQLDVDLGEGLAVPEAAIIPTGTRFIAFVAAGTRIEPRAVTVEGPFGGWYRVTAGLDAGEKVAASAQFLLDSESRIRASGGGGGHAGH